MLLEELGVQQYKVASGEVTNLPLLERIADTGKPVLLSSGMSPWAELDQAVELFQSRGNPITVMQCTSAYPCPPERVGLNVMREMAKRYGLPVGLSDHTPTPFASYAAACFGATVIEKHFTLSRRMYGSDARFATEPEPFAEMVQGIRAIQQMLHADVDKDDLIEFEPMRKVFQKSIVTRCAIPAGTRLDRSMLTTKKPGTGIPANQLDRVVGQAAVRKIEADTLLRWEDLTNAPDGPGP